MSDSKYFSKSVLPKCAYCEHARLLSNGEEVFCVKKGPRDLNEVCHSYKYDPLKRVPKSKDIGRAYSPEDFKL